MFKSSITKFLIASLGILMTGLFVAALILAVEAWTNYALAGRIARLTSTDKTLFDALVTVRAQVPKNSTALITEEDPKPPNNPTNPQPPTTLPTPLIPFYTTDFADQPQL